jgi:small subunit ribosomal protein S17
MASETSAASAAKVASERNSRRIETGIVTSDVRHKTITVEIKHLVKHARYGKYLNRSTHLHAHDEKNEAKKGDRVEVVETRPISKQKRWRLVRVVERAVVLGQLDIKEVEIAPKKAEPAAPAAAEAGAAEGAPKA